MTITPFLFAAENPVTVESRESTTFDYQTVQSTVPFQPIEGEFADSRSGESEYQIQLLQQEVQSLRGLVEGFNSSCDRCATHRTIDIWS